VGTLISVFLGAAGAFGCTGMPISVEGLPDRALRTTFPWDHNKSVEQPSQRTTACAGPFRTDSGSAF
jgi:hypothetical protein